MAVAFVLKNPNEFWDQRTPSRIDGISALKELELRQKICRYILSILSSLKIKSISAQMDAFIFVQSYYNVVSFKNASVDKYDIGLASIFLSLKLNNSTRSSNELVLNQWKYLSPKVPLPLFPTKGFQKRVDCIVKAEKELISKINFRVLYDLNVENQEQILMEFFPHFNSKDPKYSKLMKYYFFVAFHSSWTHVGLCHDKTAVFLACLKLAVKETNKAEKLSFSFNKSLFKKFGVEAADVENIVKALNFGDAHIPGKINSHDSFKPADMAKFHKPRPSGSVRPRDQSGRDSEEPLWERVYLEDNFVLAVYDIPDSLKHQSGVRQIFLGEEINWTKFVQNDAKQVDLYMCFRDKRSIMALFDHRIFVDKKGSDFKVVFEGKTCNAVLESKDKIKVQDIRIDESASVHVNDLSSKTTEEDVYRAFKKFGKVVSVKIPDNLDTRYPLFAFVNFRDIRSKDRALEAQLTINGKAVDVHSRSKEDRERDSRLINGVKVERISFEKMDEFDLIDAFSQFGPIVALCALKNRGNPLGINNIAFVFFERADSKMAVLKSVKRSIDIKGVYPEIDEITFRIESIMWCPISYPVEVRGINSNCSSLDFKNRLKMCGSLINSKLIYDDVSRGKTRTGFGLFSKRKSQKLALEMKNFYVQNRRVTVTLPSMQLGGASKQSLVKSNLKNGAPGIKEKSKLILIECRGDSDNIVEVGEAKAKAIFSKKLKREHTTRIIFEVKTELSADISNQLKKSNNITTTSIIDLPENWAHFKSDREYVINFTAKSARRNELKNILKQCTDCENELKISFMSVLGWVAFPSLSDAERLYRSFSSKDPKKVFKARYAVSSKKYSVGPKTVVLSHFDPNKFSKEAMDSKFSNYGTITASHFHSNNKLATIRFEQSQEAFQAFCILQENLEFLMDFGPLRLSLSNQLAKRKKEENSNKKGDSLNDHLNKVFRKNGGDAS